MIEPERIPIFFSMKHQKHYYKIDENWGFVEDTYFPNMFDFKTEITEYYTVWRGDSELTHINGEIIPDPYTGQLTLIEFKDYESALEFCLQVKEHYEKTKTN